MGTHSAMQEHADAFETTLEHKMGLMFTVVQPEPVGTDLVCVADGSGRNRG